MVLASSVTPDYLKVMGIPLREGRFFDDQDRIGAESVAVIDDVMARQAFGGEDPIGKQLWIDLGADPVRWSAWSAMSAIGDRRATIRPKCARSSTIRSCRCPTI